AEFPIFSVAIHPMGAFMRSRSGVRRSHAKLIYCRCRPQGGNAVTDRNYMFLRVVAAMLAVVVLACVVVTTWLCCTGASWAAESLYGDANLDPFWYWALAL